ncbi:penicillin-binding protein 2 [Massilia sp. TS11]|uniref:peptidoglycan D,D-transpeptidase FtsI family protein n=1 Tax=Massilia sp. TS11 TaxID=2908003 RepID=UPI001EDA58B6|nr:penicillin-binding protein 2 [Massilia sp. TS11]MCG2585328.1 penicillin-binding protein 2 [Massilia sp. TS11]
MKRSERTHQQRVAAGQGVKFTTSPVLAVRMPSWRSRFVVFVLFLAFAALAVRALWLQGMSTQFLQRQGEIRYARTFELPATRGKITDRNGQVLASSLPAKALYVEPEVLREAPAAKLSELAKLLEMPEAELRKKLSVQRDSVLIKRQVELDAAEQIAKLDLPGIDLRKDYKRFYPQGEVMTHLVGFTNVEDVGQEGIELGQQKTLVGQPGSRRVIRDRLGRIIEDIGAMKEPRDGKDLTLSVDSKLQYIAFTQIKEAVQKYNAKAAAAVVLDIHTGEVLALANWPSYNPNERSTLTGEQLRNRVLTDTFEPGSTLKPLTVALALENKRITPETVFDTSPGRITIGDHTVRDSHAHGLLTVKQIIQKSSNVGMSKIALPMPAQDMWEIFTKSGFGQAPKFGFPGAVAGRVRPYKSWRPIEQANMAFGQGISVSLLQLARSYMIYGRDGDIIPLSFQKLSEPPQGTPVISPKTAAQMREMLEMVVSPEGTAPQAQVPGYRVGGKTGTAQKIINGRYSQSHYIASFVGIAPMSKPRFVIAVMVDDPVGAVHTGGGVAAPTFSLLAANALRAANVPPDSSVTNIIIPANAIEESM